MKKYIGALLAAGMVFALVLGSAAALDINNVDPLQVGVTDERAFECDRNGVDVLVGFEDQEVGEGRNSNSIIVSDIHERCAGNYLVAIALDGEGNELTRGVAENIGNPSWYEGSEVSSDTNAVRIPWKGDVDPLEVEGVELHLNG